MKKIITVMIALGATILASITSAPKTVKASGDITDLTGTKWEIDDGAGGYPYYEEYFINFYSAGEFFESIVLYEEAILYGDIVVAEYASWYDQKWLTIEITGGLDATNTELIAWLLDNAILTYQAPLGYNISFESNGGSSVTGLTGVTNIPNPLPVPVRTNYQFIGWYLDAELTQEVEIDTPITSDITLYAKWQIVSYTITVNLNDGVVPGTSTTYTLDLNHGDTLTMLSTPTREDYTFVGWYLDEELTQEFDIDTPITSDITLYAKWESHYRTISFVTNANRTKTPITILSGESLGYVPSAPSNRGYTFIGWYYDEELTQEFDIDTPITSDITLYAKWQLIDNDRIEFTHSDTESWNGTVTPGTTEKLYGLLNKYGSLENGYMKLYWASLMIDGQVYLVNIEDTSHGLWIYYLYAFGNRPEYELYFWDDNMTYNEYGYHMIPYGDIVISYYPTHTVSYNTNGGTAINDMTVDRFFSFDEFLPIPSRSEYYFAGWYLDEELTKDFNEGDYIAEFTVDRNITLYAKWVEDEEEIITEEKNEIIIITSGGTTYAPLIKYSNAGITVDEILDYVDGVERYGYVFMGWYLDAFHEIPLDTYDYFTQTTRIYAKWQRLTYTIAVNLNDGVVPGTSTTYTVDLNHGDTLAKLSTPIREGYTFVGWSISGYDTIYTGPIEESMNVVAVWKTSETEKLQIKTEHIVYAAIIVGLLIILKQTSRKRRYR